MWSASALSPKPMHDTSSGKLKGSSCGGMPSICWSRALLDPCQKASTGKRGSSPTKTVTGDVPITAPMTMEIPSLQYAMVLPGKLFVLGSTNPAQTQERLIECNQLIHSASTFRFLACAPILGFRPLHGKGLLNLQMGLRSSESIAATKYHLIGKSSSHDIVSTHVRKETDWVA